MTRILMVGYAPEAVDFDSAAAAARWLPAGGRQ